MSPLGRVQLSAVERVAERAVLDSVRLDRIMADTRRFAQAPRVAGSSEYRRAAEYALEQAQQIPGWTSRIERRRVGLWNTYNVVLEKRGTAPDAERKLVIAGGHLDTVPGTVGANDNAVAAASALEAARAIGSRPTRHDVRVVLFDREEEGLVGARAWVNAHRGEARRAVAMLNFESSGAQHQTHPAFSLGRGVDDALGEQIQRVSSRNDLAVHRWSERTHRADHHVFARARIPSASFGVSFDRVDSIFPTYHKPSDDLQHLNETLALQHAQAATLALHDLAQAPSTVRRRLLGPHNATIAAYPYFMPTRSGLNVPATAAVGTGLAGAVAWRLHRTGD